MHLLFNQAAFFPLWGRRNLGKHACLAVLASHEHVVPRQWGGSNEQNNLVTACWSCQFSRHNYRLEDSGIIDPRNRAPINDVWDGLFRVLAAAYPQPVNSQR